MHDRKGYYFGLFYAIYGFSNITSGLITTFMLGFFDINVYFWMLEGMSVLSLLFCIFVLPPSHLYSEQFESSALILRF